LPARLEPFGRFEFDPQGSGIDPVGMPNAEFELIQTAKQDPEAFIRGLAAATIPTGGWTVYGAMRLLWHFGLIEPDKASADLLAIATAALQFLRSSGATWQQLATVEKQLWAQISAEEW
jgi:hypothetical protein